MCSLLNRICSSPKYFALFSHWFLMLNAFTFYLPVWYLAHSKSILKVCHIITSSVGKNQNLLEDSVKDLHPLSIVLAAGFRRKSIFFDIVHWKCFWVWPLLSASSSLPAIFLCVSRLVLPLGVHTYCFKHIKYSTYPVCLNFLLLANLCWSFEFQLRSHLSKHSSFT